MSASATDLPSLTACPFCLAEKRAEAPVCPSCNRDTVAPALLVQERDELRQRRDALRTELDEKIQRLSAR